MSIESEEAAIDQLAADLADPIIEALSRDVLGLRADNERLQTELAGLRADRDAALASVKDLLGYLSEANCRGCIDWHGGDCKCLSCEINREALATIQRAKALLVSATPGEGGGA